MAFFGGGSGGLDQSRCIKLAIMHDVAEAIVGDITPHDPVSKARTNIPHVHWPTCVPRRAVTEWPGSAAQLHSPSSAEICREPNGNCWAAHSSRLSES